MKDNQQPTTVRWVKPAEKVLNSGSTSTSSRDMSDSASIYGVGSTLGGKSSTPSQPQGSSSTTTASSKQPKTASQVAMEQMMKNRR